MTKYEKKIFEIVNASRDHLTAEQVLAALREEYPAVSQGQLCLSRMSRSGRKP